VEARRGVRGFAAVLEIPLDVVEGVLPLLLEDGRIRSVPDRGFIAPNYAVAKLSIEAAIAERVKTELERNRERQRKRTRRGQAGTSLPNSPRGGDVRVTDQDLNTDPGSGSLFPDPPKPSGGEIVTTSARRRIPETWQPRQEERSKARELGLDCDEEAREFLSYWLGDGRTKADWHRTFLNRLYQQAKRKKARPQSGLDAVMRIAMGEDR
jgi:hypothetical protein